MSPHMTPSMFLLFSTCHIAFCNIETGQTLSRRVFDIFFLLVFLILWIFSQSHSVLGYQKLTKDVSFKGKQTHPFPFKSGFTILISQFKSADILHRFQTYPACMKWLTEWRQPNAHLECYGKREFLLKRSIHLVNQELKAEETRRFTSPQCLNISQYSMSNYSKHNLMPKSINQDKWNSGKGNCS